MFGKIKAFIAHFTGCGTWMQLTYGVAALALVFLVWGEHSWVMRVFHNVAEAGIALFLFSWVISRIPEEQIAQHRQWVVLGYAVIIAGCFT